MRHFLPLSALFLLPSLAHSQTKPERPTQLESKVESQALVQSLLKQGKIMRASSAKRGMKGVAYSVFQGTKIEKFDVVVLGTLERGQGGGDLVLIKVTSGPVVKRQSGIIQGMSGSPVYIGGKLLGAIAIGFGFPKEPIGGVTPITQMIQGALPDNAPRKPPVVVASVGSRHVVTLRGVYTPKTPLVIQNRRIARLEITDDANKSAFGGSMNAATMRMRPATQMLLLSGVSESGLNRWKAMLAPYGITPTLGGGAMGNRQVFGMPSKKSGVQANLAPGAAIGVQLASGDIDATAVGTVTYRVGNRVLAFGHPMFNLGAVSMPMTTAYVHDIFPALDISFKLASPIRGVGELQQDTNFAIGGTVGKAAQTVPLRISLVDPGKKINRKYNVRLIKDPTFTAQIAQSIAVDALQTTFGLDSDKMVRISFAMGLKNGPAIHRTNTVYASDQVVAGALGEMLDALSLTQANPYEKGNITSMDLRVQVVGRRQTARIRRVYADKNRLKAGESAQVSVVLEPTGQPDETVTKRFTVRVPDDAPNGVLRIVASSAGEVFAARQRVGGEPPRPGNFRELLGAYEQIGANDELLLQSSTPRRFLLIDRKRVSNPPPSWNRLVPSGAASSVSGFNEVLAQRQKVEYVLTGLESVSIPVESSRASDKTRPDAPSSEDASGPTVASASEATATDDSEDFVSRLPEMAELDAAPDFKTRWKRLARTLMQIPLPRPTPPVPPTPSATPTPGALPTLSATPAPGATPAATPTPTPTPTPGVEPGAGQIARPVGRFIQRTSADFSRGKFEGTLVEGDGTLRVGPRNRRLISSPEPLAWSIASDGKGVTYLGTGNSARLLRIENGVSKVIYEGPEVAVSALALDKNGILYAGVSPGGRVLKFAPDGRHVVIFNTNQTFVHALKFAENGDLIVAAGGAIRPLGTEGSRIFRLDRPFLGPADSTNFFGINSRPIFPIATLPQKHARSLAVVGDSIFVGTGEDAVLYRIDSTGKTTALYQASGGGSSAPSEDSAPPTIVSAPPGGGAPGTTVVFAAPPGGGEGGRGGGGNEILALAASGDDVYFGTAASGSIFRWNAQTGVREAFKTPGNSIYALQMLGDSLYAATGESGEVWRVSNLGGALGDISGARVLDATQPQVLALTGAGNRIFAATGNNAAAYEIGGAGGGTFTSNVFDAGQIVRFGGLNAISSGATFEFRSGNTLEPDATWTPFGKVTAGQSVSQNPARYGQYRANLGESGTVSRVEIAFRAPNRAPRVSFTSPSGGDYFSGKKTLTWSGSDPDRDPLRYSLELVGADGRAQSVELTTATASSQEIDTKKYPDGTYTARLTASDAARNAEDPLADSAVSLAFTLDNLAPTLDKPLATRDGATWRLAFSATDALSPIAGAEWRLAAGTAKDAKPGDWQAAAPADGFFDAKSESITARLDPALVVELKSGASLEIRVRDAAGNATASKIVLP